ncbi:hypothetical protein [Microbacterium thalassium]|uniref:Uncharacterized protein n=1 Tax=Microbacterium thalassium TaxID=362649 RepID=A0A7X0FSC9_9MICO|nr:hypothetical protein [Microbacterium thalassium]MBB6392245.1 hypothetical protein [Microbacterium thalassium]GLK23456.1 hypothetical protein GCM10017607_07740 [Microbacterium thalassium]
MPPDWHPILDAVEDPPGTFHVLDSQGREYGIAKLRRVGEDRLRYRAEYRGELAGWATSARVACERIHAAYLLAHGPQGGPLASWGEG